jgi:CheY-like chemotaxis protein
VQRVYELCRKEYFDDYVLFWPMTHDAPRLRMAVHHALRQLAASHQTRVASTAEFAAQARRIADLEAQLAHYARRGEQQVEAVSRSLHEAGQQIDAALDGFSRRIVGGALNAFVEVRDRGGFEGEWARLKSERIAPPLHAATKAVAPVQQWVGTLAHELAPQLEAARALHSLAEQVRPTLLLVDDDEFQHRLLAQLLADLPVELMKAASGTEALAALRKQRPDLVLMDIDLPELNGVEVTRRLKSVPQLADLPVLMVTGHSDRQLVVDSLKAGAADFLVKPFDKATLHAKLRKHLALPAA